MFMGYSWGAFWLYRALKCIKAYFYSRICSIFKIAYYVDSMWFLRLTNYPINFSNKNEQLKRIFSYQQDTTNK